MSKRRMHDGRKWYMITPWPDYYYTLVLSCSEIGMSIKLQYPWNLSTNQSIERHIVAERRPHVENEEERKAKRQRVVSAVGMKAAVRNSVGVGAGKSYEFWGEYLTPWSTKLGNTFWFSDITAPWLMQAAVQCGINNHMQGLEGRTKGAACLAPISLNTGNCICAPSLAFIAPAYVRGEGEGLSW